MKFFRFILQIALMGLCFMAGMQYERTLLIQNDGSLNSEIMEDLEEEKDNVDDVSENVDVLNDNGEESDMNKVSDSIEDTSSSNGVANPTIIPQTREENRTSTGGDTLNGNSGDVTSIPDNQSNIAPIIINDIAGETSGDTDKIVNNGITNNSNGNASGTETDSGIKDTINKENIRNKKNNLNHKDK